eukprot:gene17186-biopygen2929
MGSHYRLIGSGDWQIGVTIRASEIPRNSCRCLGGRRAFPVFCVDGQRPDRGVDRGGERSGVPSPRGFAGPSLRQALQAPDHLGRARVGVVVRRRRRTAAALPLLRPELGAAFSSACQLSPRRRWRWRRRRAARGGVEERDSSRLLLGERPRPRARKSLLGGVGPHSTARHSTAQHSTAQHSTARHGTAQYSTAQ